MTMWCRVRVVEEVVVVIVAPIPPPAPAAAAAAVALATEALDIGPPKTEELEKTPADDEPSVALPPEPPAGCKAMLLLSEVAKVPKKTLSLVSLPPEGRSAKASPAPALLPPPPPTEAGPTAGRLFGLARTVVMWCGRPRIVIFVDCFPVTVKSELPLKTTPSTAEMGREQNSTRPCETNCC